MANYFFTIDEAQENVQWLAETFKGIGPLRKQASTLHDEIRLLVDRMGGNGGRKSHDHLVKLNNDMQEVSSQIEQVVDSISQRGILVKSVDPGLVDFPYNRDGHEVYLCWKEGEDQIRYWHNIESGFAGRKPI